MQRYNETTTATTCISTNAYAKAIKPLSKWIEDVKAAQWNTHLDLKRQFPSADYVKNGRYVFNIGGNN